MPRIHLTTFIAAPADRVFDLSRNIAVYKSAFNNRKEMLSSGAASNLVNHGETIILHAKHFGKTRNITLRITALEKPSSFTEEQVKGDLENYLHEHHFKQVDNGTIMIDIIEFGPPRDIAAKVFGKFFLKKYIENILIKRNESIKQYAETEKWRAVLTA